MPFFKKELIYFSLLLLSSCLSLTEQELTQNVLQLPTIAQTAQQGVESGYFQEGAWPEKEWWEIYKDSHLSVFIKEALSNNPSLQSIEKKVELARQNAKVVRAQLFPLLFFDATETWQYLSHNGLYRAFNPKIPIGANLIDLSLSFTYEFDFWSKNLNAFRAAIGQAKADEAEAAQVALMTTTAVAQAYFALKTNLKKKKLLQTLTDCSHEIYGLQIFLKEQALYSKLIPLLGGQDYQEAEKFLVAIEEEIQVDKHLLNILVGRGPDQIVELDEQIIALPEQLTLPSTLSLDLLSRRPDLMAQIWRVEAFGKDVAIAKADFYPNVNLVGLAGLESVAYSLLFGQASSKAALQPAIHLPI
ncbi:MAG: TolC family protein, partial [Chlamydiia bacterium]